MNLKAPAIFLMLCSIIVTSIITTPNRWTDSSSGSWSTSSPASANPLQGRKPIDRPLSTHRVYLPYWRIDDGFQSRIYIRNVNVRRSLVATLSLVTKTRTISFPQIELEPAHTFSVDVTQALLTATPHSGQGSAFIDFSAESIGAINAFAQIINPSTSIALSFPFQRADPAAEKELNAVAWYLDQSTDVFVSIQNTSTRMLTVFPSVYGSREMQLDRVTLKPSEAKTVKFPQTKENDSQQYPRSVGVTIKHDGAAGALISQGWATNERRGFSTGFSFVSRSGCLCTQGQKNHLYGTGVPIGSSSMMGGAVFEPVIALRNVSAGHLTVLPSFSYFNDGKSNKVSLPSVTLAPQESTVRVLRQSQLAGLIPPSVSVGTIDLEYESESGGLLAEVASVDLTGFYTSPVPLVCGGKPAWHMSYWRTDSNWDSLLHVQNISEKESNVEITISHPSGLYILEKQLRGGELAVISVKELQLAQTPDKNGNVIPVSASTGGVNIWSNDSNQSLIINGLIVNPTTGTCGFCGGFGVAEQWGLTDLPQNCFFTPFRDYGENETVHVQMYLYFSTGQCGSDAVTNLLVLNSGVLLAIDSTTLLTIGSGTGHFSADSQQIWSGPEDPNCLAPYQLSAQETLQVLPNPPTVTINEVGFTGDHMITKWSNNQAIDSPDGTASTWTSGGTSLPVAYTKGTTVTMFAKLGINPSVSTMSAKLRVKNGSTIIANKDISLSGTNITITGISTSSALESTVKATTPTFTWEISFNGGSTWQSIGNSGPHTMYWTNATPLSPPFKNDAGNTFSTLYDLALQKACGYANGASDLSTITNNINTGIDNEINYQPSVSIGTQHPLVAYSTPSGCQCSDLAMLLRGLLRSIGIDGTTLYIWAGSSATTLTRYKIGSTGETFPSFRISRSAHDSAEANPHFKFHSVVSTNNTWYDPSYGLIYSSLSFTETANNNTPQRVSSNRWISEALSTFTCPH